IYEVSVCNFTTLQYTKHPSYLHKKPDANQNVFSRIISYPPYLSQNRDGNTGSGIRFSLYRNSYTNNSSGFQCTTINPYFQTIIAYIHKLSVDFSRIRRRNQTSHHP